MSRQILMVIAPDQFRDEELHEPRERFLAQGWIVDTVSTRTGIAKGMLGAEEQVSKTLADVEQNVKSGKYDAIVVVGGMGSVEFLWNNTQLHQLLQQMAQQQRVVSAICLSGVVLANAGLLNGKKATVWEMPESVQAYKQAGAEYTAEPVTEDGQFITANGPEAASDFAQAIVHKVNSLLPA